MDTRSYLLRLLVVIAGIILLGVALRIAAGGRWFSFYGAATMALAAIPFLGFLLFERYRTLSLSRWPVVLVLLFVALVAIIQIAFWIAFFKTGDQGLGLGIVRTMVMPYAKPWLPAALLGLATALLLIVLRGAFPPKVPDR
jgi:hypothetical protein